MTAPCPEAHYALASSDEINSGFHDVAPATLEQRRIEECLMALLSFSRQFINDVGRGYLTGYGEFFVLILAAKRTGKAR